jgi:hypothetical protein
VARCRIVHTKSSPDDASEDQPILPFTREASMLSADIALVRYLAEAVLTHAN